MKYNRHILELNQGTNVTLYLCVIGSGKMYTFHGGKTYEGEIPPWMSDYIQASETILPFIQDNMQKQYCRWVLDENNILVFLDEPSFIVQNTLVKFLIGKPYQKEVFIQNDTQIAELKNACRQFQQTIEKNNAVITGLNDDILRLKEQNADQSLRLKKVLSENLELARKVKAEADKPPQDTPEESHQKRLSYVIKSLNDIITTGNASGVDIQVLSIIMPVNSHRELENSPELVKNYIAKLIGMERTGKLTAFQLKKLYEAFKP